MRPSKYDKKNAVPLQDVDLITSSLATSDDLGRFRNLVADYGALGLPGGRLQYSSRISSTSSSLTCEKFS